MQHSSVSHKIATQCVEVTYSPIIYILTNKKKVSTLAYHHSVPQRLLGITHFFCVTSAAINSYFPALLTLLLTSSDYLLMYRLISGFTQLLEIRLRVWHLKPFIHILL